MTKKLLVLLVLCHAAYAVKYSLKFHLMISSGVPNCPDYVATADFEGELMAYYDSNTKTAEPRNDWVREFMEDDPQQWEALSKNCKNYHQEFIDETRSFKQHSNQTGGVHIIQQTMGCEWDDDTKDINGFKLFGYNGEDFITFDSQTETWITSTPLAKATKQEWDRNKGKNGIWKNFLTTVCPDWLKTYLNYRKHFVHKKDRLSVSLLQKTPSSLVTCHTTGFKPNMADLVWRKDDEEIHEGVEKGEILTNPDGTFQMSVNLNVSSVTPEDWRSYSCVFQLFGVEDEIITRLDKSMIRTNWGKTEIRNDEKKPNDKMIPIIVAVVVLVVILIAAVGFVVYKKKKENLPRSSPDNISELAENLTPEAT